MLTQARETFLFTLPTHNQKKFSRRSEISLPFLTVYLLTLALKAASLEMKNTRRIVPGSESTEIMTLIIHILLSQVAGAILSKRLMQPSS